MSRDRLWLALAVLLPALAATIAPMSTVDLAYQVRAGELMIEAREVLRVDPFTFTAMGEPWLNQQWGAGVLFALVHGIAGWGGLVVLRVLLVGAAVGLVVLGARRWLPARSAALLALAGFVVGIGALGLRAQLFGVVLFAAVLALLAWRDRRPRAAWAIPLLVLAWANLHGSFVLGPAAVAVALADDVLARRPGARSLAAVLGLSLAVTAVTPFGLEVWPYALGIATNGEISRLITEWQRTLPFDVPGLLFYASLAGVAGLVALAYRRDETPSLPTLAWLAALAALGIYAQRGIAWWAFGVPVAIAPTVAALAALLPSRQAPSGDGATGPGRRREPAALRVLNAVLAAAVLVAVAVLQPIWRDDGGPAGPPGLLRDAPVGIAAALTTLAGPEDRAVVPQPWASWIEWAAPGIPVMVDSRIEVVPVSAWEDYLVVVAGGPAALDALERLRATAVVVDRATQTGLDVTLRGTGSGWRLAHEDADGLVFVPAP